MVFSRLSFANGEFLATSGEAIAKCHCVTSYRDFRGVQALPVATILARTRRPILPSGRVHRETAQVAWTGLMVCNDALFGIVLYASVGAARRLWRILRHSCR